MESLIVVFLSLVVLWLVSKLVIKFFWLAFLVVSIIIWANWERENSNGIENPKVIHVVEEEVAQKESPSPQDLTTQKRENESQTAAHRNRPPAVDVGCMKYRHLLPVDTEIRSASRDSGHLRNQVEFEWLLWQRNIDPLKVVETGLLCSFNSGEFVIHEYELMGRRDAVKYERLNDAN